MQTITLDLLDPAARNANRMPPPLLAQLTENMSNDPGTTLQPVLVRSKVGGRFEIVDGHHRVQAARLAGWKAIDAVVQEMSDDEAERTAIALNKIRGELDLAIVGEVFAEQSEAGFDPQLFAATGFSPEEVDSLIASATDDPDEEHPEEMARTAAPEASPERGTWELEVSFTDRKDRDRVRRVARKLGGGDPAQGLLRLVEAEEGEGELEKLLAAADLVCAASATASAGDHEPGPVNVLRKLIKKITTKRSKKGS